MSNTSAIKHTHATKTKGNIEKRRDKGLHHLFLQKMAKIKNVEVLMQLDWEFNYELNEV